MNLTGKGTSSRELYHLFSYILGPLYVLTKLEAVDDVIFEAASFFVTSAGPLIFSDVSLGVSSAPATFGHAFIFIIAEQP